MGKIILMNDFNVDRLFRHFDLKPEQTVERDAMRYVFSTMKSELSAESPGIDTASVVSTIIESLEPRYNLGRSAESDFLGDDHDDKTAFALVLICSHRVVQMAGHAPRWAGPGMPHNFDPALVMRAEEIWEGACAYTSGTYYPDSGSLPSRPSLLIAHLDILEDLFDMRENIGDYDEVDIANMLNEEIPNAQRFAARGTALGDRLSDFLTETASALTSYLALEYGVVRPDATSAARKHPHLSLVPGPQPQ